MSNNNIDSEGDSKFRRSWSVEWNSALGRSVSEERLDYADALKIFNEKSQGGGDVILYEIQKSVSDGQLLKKIPVLNTRKARQRQEEKKTREQVVKQDSATSTGKPKSKFADNKARIFILAAAIAALMLLLLAISSLANLGTGQSSDLLAGYYINNHHTQLSPLSVDT